MLSIATVRRRRRVERRKSTGESALDDVNLKITMEHHLSELGFAKRGETDLREGLEESHGLTRNLCVLYLVRDTSN
jgi:hypothetical protein